MKPIVDGKVKSVYQGVDPEQVLIHYHDKVTAGNGEKEDYLKDKGKINCDISCIIFKELEKAGVNTHFIQYAGPSLMRCKKVAIIPIEVVVRNIADGSIVRQTTIPKDTVFNPPLIEFYLKEGNLLEYVYLLMIAHYVLILPVGLYIYFRRRNNYLKNIAGDRS